MFLVMALALTAMTACAVNGKPGSQSGSGVMADHPALSEQEKLTPCFQCHKDATPEVYDQWYNSGHVFDNVRCFQCHGTYEQLKRVPDEATCSICHSAEFHKKPAGSSCWQCHPAHAFNAHK